MENYLPYDNPVDQYSTIRSNRPSVGKENIDIKCYGHDILFWNNQKSMSLHFVEMQPIFHLSYGILVRKSKQRWELYSHKTRTSSNGYKLYDLDLSLDNSS